MEWDTIFEASFHHISRQNFAVLSENPTKTVLSVMGLDSVALMNIKAANVAKWTLISNVLQKLVTFVFNTLLVRKTHPSIFGVAAVQLELLLSTLLFLSREGVRLAVMKESSSTKNDRQNLVNISWLPAVMLMAVGGCVTGYMVTNVLPDDSQNHSSVSIIVVFLYCAGALLECFSEPWINMYQVNMLVAPKARAEGIESALRTDLEWYAQDLDTRLDNQIAKEQNYQVANNARCDTIEASATLEAKHDTDMAQEVADRKTAVAGVQSQIDHLLDASPAHRELDQLSEIVSKFSVDGSDYASRLNDLEAVVASLVEQLTE